MHWFLSIISKPQNLLISNHNTSPKRKNIWTEVSCIGLRKKVIGRMAYWGQKSHSLMHKAQESVVCEIMECLMRQKSVVKLPTVRARWWACEHGNGAARPGSVRARACMYVCVGRIRCISCSDSPTFETRQREKGKDNLTMHMAEVFPWLASLDCDCFHLTSKAVTARDLFINYSDGLGISL